MRRLLAEALPDQGLASTKPLRSRALEWAGILSSYFGSQTLTQLLGVASGLLLVRFMPLQEFALYTLATSAVTIFTLSTDLGSTASLVHFFREAAKEGEDFRGYLSAVLSLRRAVFLVGAIIVLLVLPAAAARKGFALRASFAVTAAVLVAVWLQIVSSPRLLALRLTGHYGDSYRAEIWGGALRLILTLAMLASAFLQAWAGIAASALGVMLTAHLADSPAAHAEARAIEKAAFRRRILRFLLPTLPSALFFSVQGPLTVWLCATFGTTHNIAEVGALSRLGLIVGLLSGLSGAVLLPRLASIKDDRLFRVRSLQFALLLSVLAGLILAGAVAAPKAFLALLGPHYSGLQTELLLLIAGSGLTLVGGYTVSVNFARGWTRFQPLTLVVEVATQAALVAVLPLSRTSGVLLFMLLSAATGLTLQLVVLFLGFRRPAWVRWI
ncbi:MAG TPA: hypothetical protein VHR45_06680 [Thermoanaerobaculia bacterium]|nr:hypothetical protein [Thermoanaerobaculia bacterium]